MADSMDHKVNVLETLVVRYHERFITIRSRLQYFEKKAHIMKLESVSGHFNNKKVKQFLPYERIISTNYRSIM